LDTIWANRRPNVQVAHDLGQCGMSALQAAQQGDWDESAAVLERHQTP